VAQASANACLQPRQSRDLIASRHLLHVSLPDRDHQPLRRRDLRHSRPAHGYLTFGGLARFARNRMALFRRNPCCCAYPARRLFTPVDLPRETFSSLDPPCSRRAGAVCSAPTRSGRRRRVRNRLRRAHLAHHRCRATLDELSLRRGGLRVAVYYRGRNRRPLLSSSRNSSKPSRPSSSLC